MSEPLRDQSRETRIDHQFEGRLSVLRRLWAAGVAEFMASGDRATLGRSRGDTVPNFGVKESTP